MTDFNKLSHDLAVIDEQIKNLIKRKKHIVKIFRDNNIKPVGTTKYFSKSIWLYVLELEENKYYVGMSRNVTRRFTRHGNGTGSEWTKLYKPIKILSSVDTTLLSESEASILEDKLTLETAENYGYDNVRGGQWCSVRKGVPEHLRNNGDRKWIEIKELV